MSHRAGRFKLKLGFKSPKSHKSARKCRTFLQHVICCYVCTARISWKAESALRRRGGQCRRLVNHSLLLYRGSSTLTQFDSASPRFPSDHSDSARAARASSKSGYRRTIDLHDMRHGRFSGCSVRCCRVKTKETLPAIGISNAPSDVKAVTTGAVALAYHKHACSLHDAMRRNSGRSARRAVPEFTDGLLRVLLAAQLVQRQRVVHRSEGEAGRQCHRAACLQ